MRVFVLAHLEDQTAVRLTSALRARRTAESVTLISAEELALARWAHRLDSTYLLLASGLDLSPAPGDLLIQRIRHLPAPHFARAKKQDQEYAASELHALFLSWLQSLPAGVCLNPPSPRGLAGADRAPLEWLALARQAGLPTAMQSFGNQLAAPSVSPLTPLVVANGFICGDAPSRHAAALRRFALLAHCPMLEVHHGLTRQGLPLKEWQVFFANPVPECTTAQAAQLAVALLPS
jgi:hypothetical protein